MALSNIFREPRRELTEQAFGFIPISAFGALSWFVGTLLAGTQGAPPFAICVALGTLLSLLGLVILFGGLLLMHLFGEIICDAMEDRGLDPRPKDRR